LLFGGVTRAQFLGGESEGTSWTITGGNFLLLVYEELLWYGSVCRWRIISWKDLLFWSNDRWFGVWCWNIKRLFLNWHNQGIGLSPLGDNLINNLIYKHTDWRKPRLIFDILIGFDQIFKVDFFIVDKSIGWGLMDFFQETVIVFIL
jgi:hypothetical protein